MSEENVEVVHRAIEAFRAGMERGDPGAAYDTGVMAVDAEWVVQNPFEGRTVWAGREEFVEFVRTWTEQLDDWSVRVERLIDVSNDRVAALMHQSAIGKESRVPVEWDNGVVYELKDGCVIRLTNYPTHTEALEAAGLSE